MSAICPVCQRPEGDDTILSDAPHCWVRYHDPPENNALADCALAAHRRTVTSPTPAPLDIVFDGPPGPESGRFVECERDGKSANVGEWIDRGDGFHALRIRGVP